MSNASRCKSCGASIEWRRTTAGRPIPCDLVEIPVLAEQGVPKGERETIVNADGAVVTGRKVAVGTPGAVVGPRSHFATCPQAEQHRRAR